MSVKDRAVEWAYAAAWRLVRALPEPRGRARLFRAVPTGPRATARWRCASAGEPTCAQVVGPDMPDDEFDAAGTRRDALVRPLLAGGVPAAVASRRAAPDRLRRCDGHEVLLANVAAGPGVDPGAAARGQLGRRRRLGRREGHADHDGRRAAQAGRRSTERFLAFRESLGMEILPLTGGDRPTLDVLAERFEAGAVVPLLADRDFSARGVAVDVLRPPDPDAGRPGDPRAAYRRAALHGRRCGTSPSGPVGSCLHRDRAARPVLGTAGRAGPAGDPDDRRPSSPRASAEHPADWHMLARMFLPDEPRRRSVARYGSAPAGSGADAGTPSRAG